MSTPIPFPEHRFYTPKQVAGILQVSASTVWRIMQRGQIFYTEFSPRVRRIQHWVIVELLGRRMPHDGEASAS